MFKVGDKVVPNGFRYKGDTHKHGTYLIMIKWGEESKVLTVCDIEQDDKISVTDGFNAVLYHPSELRIATEKEIEALNETKEQKFEFDFDNNFYVLELNYNSIFVATYLDSLDNIFGLNNEDVTTFITRYDIKKIMAIIPKR